MALTKSHNRMISGSVKNVVDFGAVGDGATDDSAAIQAALDAAGEKATIFLPKPDVYYKIDSGLALLNGQTIEGEGLEYDSSTGTGGIVYTGSSFALFGKEGQNDTDNTRNISIKNLRIEVTGSNATAIRLEAAKSCQLENLFIVMNGAADNIGVDFFSSRGAGVYNGCFYNNVRHVRIRGNDKTNGHIGIFLRGTTNDGQANANILSSVNIDVVSKGVQVQNSNGNSFYGLTTEVCDEHGILFNGTASYNHVYGFYHEQVSSGGYIVQSAASTEYNTVFATIITPNDGDRLLLNGNRNRVFLLGRQESDGTMVYRATAEQTSESRNQINYQDSSSNILSGVDEDGVIFGSRRNIQSDLTNVGAGGITLDPSSFQTYRLRFTASPGTNTISVTGGENGQRITLFLQQDGTGSHTVTQARFDSNFYFAGNSYTMTSTANAVDILTFERIGSLYYEVARVQNLGT